MEKKLIITISSGKFYEKLSAITHPRIEKYAKKINAEFKVLETKLTGPTPHWDKLQIYSLLDDYDRIVWIDSDILIRDDAPDIFEIVPKDKIGVFNEAPYTDRSNFAEYLYHSGINPSSWDRKYYNTGVIVCSKMHKFLFLDPDEKQPHFYEQSYLNLRLIQTKLPIFNLPYKFNRMSCVEKLTGEERFDSFFLHYAGQSGIMGEESLLKLVKDDDHRWKVDHPSYKYKKRIIVFVEGGLGDQICAEPTIRYMINRVNKDDDILVYTHWTEIFSHLKDKVTLLKANDPIPPEYRGAYEAHTMRSPQHISWQFITHALNHAVDFASIQAMKMQLPIKEKQIKLVYEEENISNLKKLGFFDIEKRVLIHPGKGWQTKTFSSDFWNMVIETLKENKIKPIIIGKNMDKNQGVVPVNYDGCLNLTDQLSNTDLFAAVQNCQALITNDSSPLHVAGSSDCWIGLIASCKFHEYILPFRNKSQFYKVELLHDLEKAPYNSWNISGAKLESVTMDHWEGDQNEFLPNKEKIQKFIDKIF